jgi:hypothetical protein
VPAEALTKLSDSVRSLIEELLEPEGRERRRRAIQTLNGAKTDRPSGVGTSATKPAYRRGWLVATVTDVLRAADGPMQARAIHRATEKLAGEPVSWSSVSNFLASGTSGKTARFERLGYGLYRIVPTPKPVTAWSSPDRRTLGCSPDGRHKPALADRTVSGDQRQRQCSGSAHDKTIPWIGE